MRERGRAIERSRGRFRGTGRREMYRERGGRGIRGNGYKSNVG